MNATESNAAAGSSLIVRITGHSGLLVERFKFPNFRRARASGAGPETVTDLKTSPTIHRDSDSD